MPPVFITAHIHTDGPIPGPHSLLTLSSAAYSAGVYGIAGHCSRFARAPEMAQVRITGSSRAMAGDSYTPSRGATARAATSARPGAGLVISMPTMRWAAWPTCTE